MENKKINVPKLFIIILIISICVAISINSQNNQNHPQHKEDSNLIGLSMKQLESIAPKDSTEAKIWWRELAEQENADDPILLGDIYRFHVKDSTEAVKWYRKAAEHGVAAAQWALGQMYNLGDGVKKDDVEAVRWWKKASEQGLCIAQFDLGSSYYNGEGGLPLDYVEAVKWYRKAAENGCNSVEYTLGVSYRDGIVVPKNDVLAYMWFNLSAVNNPMSAVFRDSLAIGMTKEQISEAQKSSIEWLEKHHSK